MSEENGTEEKSFQITGKKRDVNVIIKKETDADVQKEAEVYAKAQRYESLLDGIREKLNEKWDTDIFSSIESENQIIEMDKLLDEKQRPKRKPSSGSVRLGVPQSNNPMQREFESPLTMIRFVYDHSANPNSPYYNQMKHAKKQLREKFNLDNFPKTTEMYSDRLEEEAVQELGKNFTYNQYTEWIQEKAREAQARGRRKR